VSCLSFGRPVSKADFFDPKAERNLKNYSRNLLAYGIRFGMYIGMGVLLALAWMRLGTSSNKINDRLSVQ